MERITINENGNTKEVSIVRYIKNNENKYLIYTMGEIEGELQRIYIAKVLDQNGLEGIKVPDEEWDTVKKLIQEIVKENRANMPVQVPDLDEKTLNNIRIEDKRIIKLKADNIPTLEANKNYVVESAKPIEVEAPVIPEINVNPVIDIDVPKVEEPTFAEPAPVEPVVQAVTDIPAEPEIPATVEPAQEPTITLEPVALPTENLVSENVAPVENTTESAFDFKEAYENECKKTEELTREVDKIKEKINRICEILKEQ